MVDTFYTNFNGQLQPKSRLPEKKRELCKKFSINGFGGGETNQRLEKKKENKKKIGDITLLVVLKGLLLQHNLILY